MSKYGTTFSEYVKNRWAALVERGVNPERAYMQAAGEFVLKLKKKYEENPPTPPKQ